MQENIKYKIIRRECFWAVKLQYIVYQLILDAQDIHS